MFKPVIAEVDQLLLGNESVCVNRIEGIIVKTIMMNNFIFLQPYIVMYDFVFFCSLPVNKIQYFLKRFKILSIANWKNEIFTYRSAKRRADSGYCTIHDDAIVFYIPS